MKSLQHLYQLKNIPLNKAAGVISRAFYDDPLYAYIIPDESERKKYFPYIFKAYIWYCLHFGEVYASSANLEGIALWIPSEYAYITPERSKECGDEVFFYMLGRKYLERLSVTAHPNEVHEQLVKEPHVYLMVLAVDPEYQRKGFGRKLLLSSIEYLDKTNQKCYLDTNKESNVSYYQKFGFEVLKKFDILNTGVTNWSMLRTPKD
ncbi:MAG: GNAT family N-acetyltransferase [Promethearchaeota archaeon]|jgi:GNAT superfamily N-acetyltransferase